MVADRNDLHMISIMFGICQDNEYSGTMHLSLSQSVQTFSVRGRYDSSGYANVHACRQFEPRRRGGQCLTPPLKI